MFRCFLGLENLPQTSFIAKPYFFLGQHPSCPWLICLKFLRGWAIYLDLSGYYALLVRINVILATPIIRNILPQSQAQMSFKPDSQKLGVPPKYPAFTYVYITFEHHHLERVNQLLLWPCSTTVLVSQGVFPMTHPQYWCLSPPIDG